ncbi:neurabin-1-like, partial [Engraulis encrasicolus]|uniref:neurabin-1-like n=1 Tax=Engraulis encrasicolus TaxID=184585 RepID=UPI002FD49D50
MLKTEASSSERTTLRSASPHRNAYRAEFQALKKAFDQPRHDDDPSKQKDPERVRQPRGRQYGAHVSRIKDIFMQLGTEGTTRARKGGGGGDSSTSPQKLAKPTNFGNRADGTVIKLQHAGSVDRAKFSETRKLFEQSSRDTSQSPVSSFGGGRDRRGGSHEHLDDWRGARSNRGSTDSLDSLCSRNEASSPTVSQLSAVFENADRHQPHGPGTFLRRSQSAGRALCSPDGQHLSEDDSSLRQSPVRGVYRTRIGGGGGGKLPVSSSAEDLLTQSPLADTKLLDREGRLGQKIEEVAKEAEELDQKKHEVDGVANEKLTDGEQTTGNGEATPRVGSPQPNEKATEEETPTGSPTAKSRKPKDDEDKMTVENHNHEEEEGEEEDEEKRLTSGISEEIAEEADEEYCGNERVIFNADGDACYQGWGESCTDDDVDDDATYDPGSELTEIPGLPEEVQEEVPHGRKIRFSTSPMT